MTAGRPETAQAGVPPRSGWRLGFAAAMVMLAAADTYVVVLALPSIMAGIGLSLDHLEAATPIVSSFLLGYVALLPLLGRLSDRVGRVPVFAGCLVAFAFGSLVTASAQDLTGAVVGRALQGAGGGGLVPVTLAIVADLWPAGRRGVPLGVVGAVQELGSVLGPVYGAVILSVSTWRLIFWLNLPLSAILGAGFLLARPVPAAGSAAVSRRPPDVAGATLLGVALIAGALAVSAPGVLAQNIVWGVLYAPLAGSSAWTTPMALAALAATAGFCAWEAMGGDGSPRLLPLRRLPALWRELDGLGGLLLAILLGCIVISFSTADPSRALVSPAAAVLLPIGAVALAALALRERRSPRALVPLREISDPAALGALLSNLAIGAALMAALVDVPIFARATADPNSQLGAALVLVRLLVAVPIGALAGGLLCERFGYRATTAAGMALSTAMFVLMARWGTDSIGPGFRPSDPVLVGCGFGFGLAIAPINAAILGAVSQARHGLAAALVVVARMMGMLVGVSLLTAIGLHAFYRDIATVPSPATLCPANPLSCSAYDTVLQSALLDELRTVFLAAAVCTALAGLVGGLMLRRHGGRHAHAMEAALGA